MYDVDLLVIGAGSGGVRAARTAAAMGASVAIAEDSYLGGTCVNVGCVPKKLYAYAAKFAADFADSEGFGWECPKPAFHWETLRDNKKAEIARLNDIYSGLLEKAGVRLLEARARILDPHTVEAGGSRISARYILVATGGWPYIPDFPGKELVISSNEIFDLAHFPRRLLVVGGGYIGVEFAGIFSGLGSAVTLVHRGDKLLRGFDEDVRDRFMREAGKYIDIVLNNVVVGVERHNGGLRAALSDGSSREADCILLATGRSPRTEGLGLENTAVRLGKGGTIEVDEQFRTAEPSIYALGDVVGRMELTPVALAEAMAVAEHMFGNGHKRMSYDCVPTAVFSHPNIGAVGLTESQARQKFNSIQVFESDFRHLKHTLSGRDERTYMKIIVARETDRVVGMHMIGEDAGEIIQGFAAAMIGGITKTQLDSTIGIHPTAAEEFVTMRTARP